MTKEIKQLKKEFLPGGSKRQYILDKAELINILILFF